jgi:hypothetical protein
MGSGFRTFAASEVLTGSNVQNYLMEQSVMSFASTGARDAAVTSPEAGMVAYVRSNDSSEGLYHYTSASSWRKGPGWNAPWGSVGVAKATSDTTLSTSSQTSIGISATFTAITNRRYRISYACTLLASAASLQTCTFELWNASAKVEGLCSVSVASTAYYIVSGVAYATATAGSTTWTIRALAGGGGGTVSHEGTVSPGWIVIEDIGPSGVPA